MTLKAGKDDVVYLSGPMTGLPGFGRERMRFAEGLARQCWPDAEVVNPADVPADWTWEQAMEQDLRTLRERATVVVLLSGWEKSKGARLEVRIALERNLPIVSFEELLHSCFKGTDGCRGGVDG